MRSRVAREYIEIWDKSKVLIKGIKTWEWHKPEQCWHTDKQSSLCDPTHSLRYNCSCLHDQSTTELINYFQFSVYNRGGGGGLFYLNSVDRVDMFVADLNKKIHYGEIWKFSRKCEIFSCFEDAFQCQSIHQSGENTNCGEKREKLFCENCKLFRTIQVTAQIGQHQRKQQNNIFLLAHWTQSDVQRHNNFKLTVHFNK